MENKLKGVMLYLDHREAIHHLTDEEAGKTFNLADCRLGIRPDQLSADACHGPERGRRHRFGHRSRYPAWIPGIRP